MIMFYVPDVKGVEEWIDEEFAKVSKEQFEATEERLKLRPL